MKKSTGNTSDSHITDPADVEVDGATDPESVAEFAEGQAETLETVDVDERVSMLQRELTTERDKFLRLAAEFDNFRKRMLRERSEAEIRGQSELVRQLLDPLDDISRFADLDPAVTECATVVKGVDMVEKKLEKQLRAAGLEPLNPVGSPFDPSLHEAVATEPAESADLDGTVSQVYQVGYTFKGQLLRPARVVVRQHSGSR
ncbi:MAG: nucleotide exchange factor GrpE [Gemmatimonadaceae bacterium]